MDLFGGEQLCEDVVAHDAEPEGTGHCGPTRPRYRQQILQNSIYINAK